MSQFLVDLTSQDLADAAEDAKKYPQQKFSVDPDLEHTMDYNEMDNFVANKAAKRLE